MTQSPNQNEAADYKFGCQTRVRWSDCDVQGIVFNGMYLSFIEVAQAEYFRNLGIALYDPKTRERFDTATVKATIEYLAPARIDDIIEIRWRISRIGKSSMTTFALILNAQTGERLARAEMININFDSQATKSRPVPPDIRRLIEAYEGIGQGGGAAASC